MILIFHLKKIERQQNKPKLNRKKKTRLQKQKSIKFKNGQIIEKRK